jgi:hypothetical protein
LLKDIRVGSLAKFEKNVDPFLRAHPGSGKRVRSIGLLEGIKNANLSFHYLYLRGWLEIRYFFPDGLTLL